MSVFYSQRIIALIIFFVCVSFSLTATGQAAEEERIVNIYSQRHYPSDQMLFELFQEQTGIKVNVIHAHADELIQRLLQEGSNSPADLFITTDAGHLYRAKQLNLLQTLESDTLEANIPSQFRDQENYWFGLTMRVRAIVYHKERSNASILNTYEDLADEAFAGRIAIRSSSNIYNISLLASIIAHNGVDYARQWARGMTSSFAREPYGNDREQIKAVSAGLAEYAVVNTYYLALFVNSEEAKTRNIADNLAIFFPNQEDRGAHINISGAGITAAAPHPDTARALLEFLSSSFAQSTITRENFEYPINPQVEPHPTIANWADFRYDDLNLEQLGIHAETAARIFDEVGWK